MSYKIYNGISGHALVDALLQAIGSFPIKPIDILSSKAKSAWEKLFSTFYP